jgi:hypothetical protein
MLGKMLYGILYVVVLFASIIGVWSAIACFYLLPSIRAFQAKHAKRWRILLVNLLLGWTVVGWFATLIWATRKPAQP